ncbi:unnamed protein product [Cochlearia groenlandica]
MAGSLTFTAESSMKASGRRSDKLSLHILQGQIKRDPEGYETEIHLIYKQFKASVDLFQQQTALTFSSVSCGGGGYDTSVAKDLGDRAMFLAHVTPFYPNQLVDFPAQLTDLLRTSCLAMPSGLRNHVAQALILLMNRKSLALEDLLGLFLDIQTLGDKNLRKLAFSHIVQTIRKISITDPRHKSLQNILLPVLEQEDETKSKIALVTLCELHKRKVWFGEQHERVAIAICEACFHTSPRIMRSSLRFLLDYDNIHDEDDSDASSSDDDDDDKVSSHVVINREAIYKRAASSENTNSTYSPLNHLNDAQSFAERLLSRLQTGKSIGQTNERVETKLMMMKVIARTIGLHKLHLFSFYTYLQNYAKQGRKDTTHILAAAVQACHDGVPSVAVEPLFKQIVDQFTGPGSPPEAIAVGLNVVREMCLRIPELMTEDLLRDLAMYKKDYSHEKAISAASRSLIALFREINPSLLVKKDRGRPGGPIARPKQYGEVTVFSNVPNVELLEESDNESYPYDVSEDSNDVDTLVSGDEENDSDNLENEEDDDGEASDSSSVEGSGNKEKATKGKKRKLVDFDASLVTAETSLRALKRCAEAKSEQPSSFAESDGILLNEDFRKIKELKAKKDAKSALARKGFKVPDSDKLRKKLVNPAKLETGGSSNRDKEHKKNMPRAAIRSKAVKSKRAKKKKNSLSGSQFRGRKAWK